MSSQANKLIRELMALTGATSVRQALGTVAHWKAEMAVLVGLREWRRLLAEAPKESATLIEARLIASDLMAPVTATWRARVAGLEAELAQFRQQSVWVAVGNNGGFVARCPGGLGLGTYGQPGDPTAYRWLAAWEQWVVFDCPDQATRAALAVPWLTQEGDGQRQETSAKATAAVRAQGEAGAARKDRPTPWVPGWAEEAF